MPYLIAALIVLAVLAAAIFLGAAAALYCNVMRRGIAKLNERKLRRGVEPTPYRRQAAENAPLWEELEKQTQTLRADDGAILTAHFIPADRPTRRAALVLHGYDCTAQTLAAIGGKGHDLRRAGEPRCSAMAGEAAGAVPRLRHRHLRQLDGRGDSAADRSKEGAAGRRAVHRVGLLLHLVRGYDTADAAEDAAPAGVAAAGRRQVPQPPHGRLFDVRYPPH